jgi:hypothetical protein
MESQMIAVLLRIERRLEVIERLIKGAAVGSARAGGRGKGAVRVKGGGKGAARPAVGPEGVRTRQGTVKVRGFI